MSDIMAKLNPTLNEIVKVLTKLTTDAYETGYAKGIADANRKTSDRPQTTNIQSMKVSKKCKPN